MINIFLKLGYRAAKQVLKLSRANPGDEKMLKAIALKNKVSPTTMKHMARERLSLVKWQNSLNKRNVEGIKSPVERVMADRDALRIKRITQKEWPLSGKAVRDEREVAFNKVWDAAFNKKSVS